MNSLSVIFFFFLCNSLLFGTPKNSENLLNSNENNYSFDGTIEPFMEQQGSVGKLRGIISQDSCKSNVTSQLGMAARMFCCLAVVNRSTQVGYFMEPLFTKMHFL